MKPEIVTIGVYGFDEERFFQKLVDARVDVFCDIRLRRGMRGSKYAFVNSKYLQQKIRELGIKYGSSPLIGERAGRSGSSYNLSKNVLGRTTSRSFWLNLFNNDRFSRTASRSFRLG